MGLVRTTGRIVGALVVCLMSLACFGGSAWAVDVAAVPTPLAEPVARVVPQVPVTTLPVAPPEVVETAPADVVEAPVVDPNPIRAVDAPTSLRPDAVAAVEAPTSVSPDATPIAPQSRPMSAAASEARVAAVSAAQPADTAPRRAADTLTPVAGGEASLLVAPVAVMAGFMPVPLVLPRVDSVGVGAQVVTDAFGQLGEGSMSAAAASVVAGLDNLAWSSGVSVGALGLLILALGLVPPYRSRLVVRYVECPG